MDLGGKGNEEKGSVSNAPLVACQGRIWHTGGKEKYTMSTITFDTFKFVNRLEKAGLSREQAAAIVEAQQGAFDEALDSTLATRTDIARLESASKEGFSATYLSIAMLDAKIDKLSWMLGIVIALAVANFAKQFF
jgi:hypothetical protein